MGLLLYKSNEMYSSTELIRKSKMIFNKVLDKEIEKAIILRDGKPCFLLMEFQKYEKIMAEFEELKEYVNSLEEIPQKQKIKGEENKVKNKNITHSKTDQIKTPPLKKTTQNKSDIPIQKITPEDQMKIEKKQIVQKEPIISEEQEIKEAYASIDAMNFNDEMKQEAQEKIKIRILQARQERAKVLADEEQNKKDLKEELILQRQLKEVKMKKDRELQEFWD